MSKRQPFADRLTPKQIQHVIDALGFDWREYYNPDNNGWVNLPTKYMFSDLSVNIYHGGFVNQYQAGMADTYDARTGIPAKGDVVTLVQFFRFGLNDENKAIAWIKEVLGTAGSTPPELEGGFEFAKDWLKEKDNNYTRIPKAILYSDLLTASEKIVWGAIFERCNGDDIYSYAGMRRISEDLNLAIGTVQKAINKLEELNLLIVKYRGKNVAPQKFPLVADKKTINKAKSAVSNSEQGCSSADTATVSNSELNNSHKQKPFK